MKDKIRNSSIVRRLLSIIAAVVMTLGMVGGSVVPAMAATGEYTITIDNSNNTRVSISGKTYSAYKVFDVTLGNPTTNEGNTTYGAYSYTIKNTDWAFTPITSGVTADATTGVYDLTSKYGIKLEPTGNGSSTYNVTGTMFDEQARKLADDLTSEITKTTGAPTAAATETATGESVVLDVSNSGAGYYAVYGTADPKDKRSDSEELVAALALTTTDKTRRVEPKVDAPTLDKKITGVSDGNEETQLTDNVLGGGKAATASVGDTVNFELTSVRPDLTGYNNYTYTIEDTLSSGLDFVATNDDNNNIVVKIGDTTLNNTKTAITGTGTAGEVYVNVDASTRKLTIQIPYASLAAGSKGTAITVSYSATVNENALGSNYDKNTAILTYSNNPSDSTKTDKTPDKNTYIVNVNINVIKKANDANSTTTLPGAKFKLYKIVDKKNYYYQWDSASKKTVWSEETETFKGDEFITGDNGTLYTIDSETGKASATPASFNGLEVGTYHLLETEAPDGYNKLDDAIPVVISATIPNEGDNSGKVVINATVNGESATVSDGIVDINAEQSKSQPVASATVVNKSGSQLPSTGGIGTTIFYVIGGVVVAGAVILLLARRRKNA